MSARSEWLALLIHLRLHYQLVFLSPLFVLGFVFGGAEPSGRALLAFFTVHVLLYGGITAYNSYFDRDTGPIGGLTRPPPVTRRLLPFSWLVQASGLGLAILLGPALTALYAAVVLLSVAYSHPRWRWKARPLLSLLVVAIGQGAIGFAAGYLSGNNPPRSLLHDAAALLGMAASAFMTVGLYPLTQLYQIDEDRARGDRTFSVAYGARASFDFALMAIALGGVCLSAATSRFGVWNAVLVAGAVGLLLGMIARWRVRFEPSVARNFDVLHALQLWLSLGTLSYAGVLVLLQR
jgi:1,4-dihydroxy-2-naphthoate octaprenyltransferase